MTLSIMCLHAAPADTSTCPSSHPFAYHSNNAHCCKTNKEKLNPAAAAGTCDGSALHAGGVHSTCCEKDNYVRCSTPPCSSYTGPPSTRTILITTRTKWRVDSPYLLAPIASHGYCNKMTMSL